ncbi:MAG: LOG family protein [Gammaproteobacteria bacterium]|nr:LOG family protein [Gammaproteobacteria bacterium]
MSTTVNPAGSLDVLSKYEVSLLTDPKHHQLKEIFRVCSLAVLNTGSDHDNCQDIIEAHKDFEIEILQTDRGVKLQVTNAPDSAFVDGEMIRGIQEHLFSTLRDLIYSHLQVLHSGRFNLVESKDITSANFHILRNAGVLNPIKYLNLVVCWGGHAISRTEYDYTKEVGYQLGLRNFDICTGCGPGAMKGPMKGAAVAHAKQRLVDSRFIGISEPEIIAAEAPNPIVNQLVIMPDIEKRLEAFARLSHAIIVFPGGVGTAEELLFLLGLLLHPENKGMPFPLVLTGPASSADYFESISEFIKSTLGEEALQYLSIIIDDPSEVARHINERVKMVKEYRKQTADAFYFNWKLHIPMDFQQPFAATHEAMSNLNLSKNQPIHELAAHLRRAFSGIVAGNVKTEGVTAVRDKGPFQLKGDPEIVSALDKILRQFVEQKRMKLGEQAYNPCYELVE